MFAGANSPYKESEFVIIGVPFDKTSSFRAGTAHAPDSIRSASFCFEPYMMEYGISLSDIAIHDKGNLKKYDDVKEMGSDIDQNISDIVSNDKVPIVLGGEHSVSPFIVKGLEKKFCKIDVVVLDAHLDYRNKYEGMKHSHATAVRRISELDIVKNLTVIGVRSISEEESRTKKIEYINSLNIDERDFKFQFKSENPIYMSIDMDVIDPSYAPGVGNPEPFGLKPKTVKNIIRDLSPSIVGLDIVETNPNFDNGEITSNLAARFVYEFIASKVFGNG
ncbi:MAG: agmatinase [Thermoplasmatota archaeon]